VSPIGQDNHRCDSSPQTAGNAKRLLPVEHSGEVPAAPGIGPLFWRPVIAAVVALVVQALAHAMHASGQCLGIARQRFAGLSLGREEAGYRFLRATGRPRQSGPRGSARGVARTPRTIPPMTLVTAGTPKCGAAAIAGEKPSECGRLVFKHPVS
jgi:hypothetical protein